MAGSIDLNSDLGEGFGPLDHGGRSKHARNRHQR